MPNLFFNNLGSRVKNIFLQSIFFLFFYMYFFCLTKSWPFFFFINNMVFLNKKLKAIKIKIHKNLNYLNLGEKCISLIKTPFLLFIYLI